MPAAHHDLLVPNGRNLAFAEYGDPAGLPVFYFHGCPSSRLEPGMFGDDLAATSLRIIALDRPGIGLSNFQPGRTFADWATDIAALADHLHWPRFGVLGNSGGGPYTAAVASLLPDRVTTAVVVSGAWRTDAPEVKANLPNINRIFWILARRFPPALGLLLHSMRQSDSKAISEAPSEADVKRLESMLPPQDVAALLAPGRMAATSVGVTEALRHGTKGAAWDARMFVHPFGFDHTAIHVPFHAFHGSLDRNVPLALAQR